jgi:lysophospholipase L1-like esterase
MKSLCLILLGLGSLFSCAKKSTPDVVPANAIVITPVQTTMPTTTDTLTYLALGDSYTIGQSVDAKQSFPVQLKDKLAAYGVQQPTIIAQTGWTTDNLINAINLGGIAGKKYDIVTLLIGVNDQYQGLSQANYRTKFVQLLNTAIGFAKAGKTHMFVLSIPDYGVTPFAAGQEATIGPLIDQFNTINFEESNKAGVNYVNITNISKGAATDLTLVAVDGLHPSGIMYAQWVALLSTVVIPVIKK